MFDWDRGPWVEVAAGEGGLGTAFREAHRRLKRGLAVRLTIPPGTYREAVTGIDWSEGKAAETPFLIQGIGKVVWSGADAVLPQAIHREGDLAWIEWPHRFGLFGYSWGPPGLIGHRCEMAFWGREPLRQEILEEFAIEGVEQNPDVVNAVAYRPLGALDPREVLAEGSFGVLEAEGRMVFRLPKGRRSLEVSTRPVLLDLAGKSQVKIAGIDFIRCCNSDREMGGEGPLHFGGQVGRPSHGVELDGCRFLWNSATGLQMGGSQWQIRRCEFSYNGFSGIASGPCSEVVWEDNKTNFNVWRAWRGGELGYFTGGFKMHEAQGHIVLGHQAIGNCTMGAWWDVHCRNVYVQDLTAIGNGANVQFELCQGPLVGRRWLVAGGTAIDGLIRLWEHGDTSLSEVVAYSNQPGTGYASLYNLRWFGRDDPHSRMFELRAGVNLLDQSVLVAGPAVKGFGMIDDIRGAEASAAQPLRYRGDHNTFWKEGDPEFGARWTHDPDRTGELADRAIRPQDWLASSSYREVSPVYQNPCLRDPENHDYRFAPESPLNPRDYPQVRLTESLLKNWRWFDAWRGAAPKG